MKILMVNKYFYIRGGSETYYFALKSLLEEHGHEVIDFSMKDPKNLESTYSDYFVENIDYNAQNGIKEKVRIGINIIYSTEARNKFEELIKKEHPDLIHLHIFQHQLSPSILDVIKKYNIPTVYTAHDLKMLCLNYKMMHNGKICEDCKNGRYYNCLLNKCVKDSLLKSSISMVEGYLHKWRRSYDAIDIIITPSMFYKKKFEEFGINPEQIIHIPNFLPDNSSEHYIRSDRFKYYLYFGRLSEEKGVMTLVKAFENLSLNLYIVGTGPLNNQIEEYIKNKKLNNVRIFGFVNGQELTNLVSNAKAVILPSEWYENGPYSVIEALQVGRPIIGANIGGIPELIDRNGFTFTSGDVRDLREKICWLEKCSADEYKIMQNHSIRIFEKNYTADYHYHRLSKAYYAAINQKRVTY